MWLRLASILAAGLTLAGCAGSLDGVSAFGTGGAYPAQPYDYAYGGPYVGSGYASPPYGYQPGYVEPYGYQPTYVAPFVYQQPGWGGQDWRRDQDRHDHADWSHRDGDWNHGQPHAWAGQPAGGHPVNLTPPPAPRPGPPPVHAPDARTQQFMDALGFKPNR